MFKAIIVKYLGPTNKLGPRLKAFSQTTRDDRNQITIPLPDLNREEAYLCAAIALRDKMGWKGKLIGGGIKQGMVFVFAS